MGRRRKAGRGRQDTGSTSESTLPTSMGRRGDAGGGRRGRGRADEAEWSGEETVLAASARNDFIEWT